MSETSGGDTLNKRIKYTIMKDELIKDLKKRYVMGKNTIKTIAMMNGADDNDAVDTYDIRLLTISIKDIDEPDEAAQMMMQVRLRKDDDKDYEEFVIVSNTKGATRPVTDLDADIATLAEIIESITEKFVEEFKDKVLLWDWLGD